MSDKFSAETRSRIMRAIKSKDTKSELAMHAALNASGTRVERPVRNCKTLRGSPDFVYWKARVAVFVHGCFWHRHSCQKGEPKSNSAFWRKKFSRNVARDKAAARHLRRAGWSVLTIWECRLKEGARADAAARIVNRVWHREQDSKQPRRTGVSPV